MEQKIILTSSKNTLIDPTLVAPTAVIEKKPCFHLPKYTTLSLMLNRPATQFTIPGATLRSSPKIKWKIQINIKLLLVISIKYKNV